MKDELKHKLNKKADKIELLERYSKFLESHGYTDSDWWSEKPTAIESFIEEEGLEVNAESSVLKERYIHYEEEYSFTNRKRAKLKHKYPMMQRVIDEDDQIWDYDIDEGSVVYYFYGCALTEIK